MNQFGKLLAIFGGIYVGAAILDSLTGEEHDTVNYTLWYKGKKVYHGICYADRLEARINEHFSSGKKFDNYTCGSSKPRSRALNLERKKIYRDIPRYNIHHNV
jgi:hypothetical protein